MSTIILEKNKFVDLIVNGYQSLANDYKRINDLNVFPVPDGDTGINMKKTMEGGVDAIVDSNFESVGELVKSMSRGMTFSARGNSGVILSQFFKGFSNGLLDCIDVNLEQFAKAMKLGVTQAYNSVNHPVEGTILTVMREAIEKAYEIQDSDFENYFITLLAEANASLERTPDLLPALKKAGVIDSGGAGFIKILEGMALAIDGNMLDYVKDTQVESKVSINNFNADSVLEFGYCTEFILQLQNSKVDIANFDVQVIIDYLETLGDSIVAFKDEDIVKVHVHTFTPGKVIDFCQQFGEYVTFKMENMSVQHSESSLTENKEYKENAYVVVSNGEGISEVFKDMGVDYIVEGGQTMNPSTDDFLKAFAKLNAKNIFVFPNNGNIILAAKQAAENYTEANVIVIETKSIAQCYSAFTMLDSEQSVEEQLEIINMQINSVGVVEVTYSIRDSEIGDYKIRKGDYLALSGKDLIAVSSSKIDCVVEAFKKYEDIEAKEVVTIIYGKKVTHSELEKIEEMIKEMYSWMEVGFIEGKQDIYNFIIAIE